MNAELTQNEKSVLDILNFKNAPEDIWTPIQTIIKGVNIELVDLETSLYFLQIRRLIRVTMDESGNVKVTTEEKVNNKLNSRINSTISSMSESELEAVENENYEDAAKYRDFILMAKDPTKQDELIDKLLEDIDSEKE